MVNKLSYIIPFYNAKNTIALTLDSVLKNGDVKEIILVDDYSSDGTREAISSYFKDYHNLKYIRNNSRLGAGASRNIGAQIASGNVLVFLDSDMVIPPESGKAIENYFFKNKVNPQPDAVVANRAKEVLCKGMVSRYKNYWTSFNLSKLKGWTYLLFSSFFAIKKEVFMDMGGFRKIPFAEDNDLGYRLILNNYKIYFASELIAWHKKRFTVSSLLKREFKAGKEGIKVKIKNKVLGDVIKNKKFFAVNKNFIYAFPLSFIFTLGILLSAITLRWGYLYVSVSSVLIITFLNREFLIYASCSRNYLKCILYVFLMIAQLNTIGLGIFFGIFEVLTRRLSIIFSIFSGLSTSFFKIFSQNLLPPEQITFFLTNRCNLSCAHCFVNKNDITEEEELTLNEIDKLSKNMGRIKFVTVTGGEPFLRDDIVDIARALHKNLKPFLLSILTNGEMTDVIVNKLRQILEICQNQNILVKLSLDGPPEVHDKMRLKSGSFKSASTTFTKLQNLKTIYPNLNLGIISTYTSQNKDVIAKFYEEVISKMNPDQYGLSLQRSDKANELNDKINIEDFIRVYETIHKKMYSFTKGVFGKYRLAYKMRIASKLKEIYQSKKYPIKCFAGVLNVVISADGNVFACEQLHTKLGSLKEEGYNWRKIWHSPRANEVRGLIRKKTCFCTNECYLPFNISYNLKELVGVGGGVSTMKKYYHLIGIIVLVVILSRIDLKRVITGYTKINLIQFGLVSMIILPTIFFKAYRWRHLLRLQGINYSLADSLLSYLGGIYAGIITPGRIGETIKAMYLKIDKGTPISEGMASVIMDRLFDLYLLMLLGIIGFWSFLGFRVTGFNFVIVFISFLVVFIPFILFNKAMLEKVSRVIYKAAISKIDKSLFDNQFKNFLYAVKKILVRRIYPVFIFTALSYLCYFWQCYLLARMMSFNISFITVVFFVSIATLFSLLPITMYGFGTREASLVYCFSLVGLSSESAVSYSFLLFTSFYLLSGFFSFIGWLLKGHYGPRVLDQQG